MVALPQILIAETSVSTGTGSFTLVAANARRAFNTAYDTGSADVFYYFITHATLDEWEYGTGHLSAATTLVRDTIIQSSNADAVVNFSAGDKNIISDWAPIIASTTVPGLVELATQAEADAGTANKILTADLTISSIAQDTAVATTSGTTISITGVPAAVKVIAVNFNGVNCGTGIMEMQLIDSGGAETTGYIGKTSTWSTSGTLSNRSSTSSFPIIPAGGFTVAGMAQTGTLWLTRKEAGSNEWVLDGSIGNRTAAYNCFNTICVGSKTLSGELTGIKINSTATFAGGSVNCTYYT